MTTQEKQPKYVRLLFTGQPKCGKTSLLMTILNGKYPTNEELELSINNGDFTLRDRQYQRMIIDQKSCLFSFTDIHGSAEYDTLRPSSYRKTDVFLLCIDVSASYSEIRNLLLDKFIPEIQHYKPNQPVTQSRISLS